MDGHCGIVNVSRRDERFKEQPCQVAAVVPDGRREDGGWLASEWLSRSVCFLFLTFVMGLSVVDADDMVRRSERWLCLRSMLWRRPRRLSKTRAGGRLPLMRGVRRYDLVGVDAVHQVLIVDRGSVSGLVLGISMRSMTLFWPMRKGYVCAIQDETHSC